MATLTRARTSSADFVDIKNTLSVGIPKPFPTPSELEQEELLETLALEDLDLDGADAPLAGPSTILEPDRGSVEVTNRPGELFPSIANVQTSCLTTLNDLLSASSQWLPILPDRRHSMPPGTPSTSASSSSSALYTVLCNLRTQDVDDSAAQLPSTSDQAALLQELQVRVDRVAQRLGPRDMQLAQTLVSLLTHLNRLSILHPPSVSAMSTAPRVSSWSALNKTQQPPIPNDSLTNLRRQLSDFQLERSTFNGSLSPSYQKPPVLAVESALLWTRIDEELETVLALCRSTGIPEYSHSDYLPPEYDPADYERDFDLDSLPQYEPSSDFASPDGKSVHKSLDPLAPSTSRQHVSSTNEKMRMDLEAVTLAIDRLYLVAPQLHNQRVELKKAKVEQMEKASREGKQKQKQKETDLNVRELEKMVELIGKASERRMTDQSVVLDGGMKTLMEKARRRDKEKRDEFVEQLIRHSDAGRMHSQEATFPPHLNRSHSQPHSTKVHDPNTLLTLPEFMREAIPEAVQRRMQLSELDPEALVTLPDFIKEPVPDRVSVYIPGHYRGQSYTPQVREEQRFAGDREAIVETVAPKPVKPVKGSRSRSLSAPPLAWLLSGHSRSSSPAPGSTSDAKRSRSGRMSRPKSSSGKIPIVEESLDVTYVAEFHENLQHVLVFLTVSGLRAGCTLEAEVVLPSDDGSRNQFILRCGPSSSQPLDLPAHVEVGMKEVKVVGGQHYEIKLPTLSRSAARSPPGSPFSPEPDPTTSALLDATHLSSSCPTSFICSSCSLPLVHASKLHSYRDLPSEHWAELVDAWMCHADMKLHEHVKKGSKEGFWPGEGEALVGGSYILVREGAVIKGNLCEADVETKYADDWLRVRCICGAVIGRCQEYRPNEESPVMVFRLTKYAFRPVSPTAEPCKVPLSAFIVEDMNEFVQAHATYRFVVVDEEDDRPRILIWLFKPNMRVAYTTPSQYVIPKSGSIRVAKVLFKLLGPSTSPSELQNILNKYPGFPQAEHLYYPIDTCRRLAGLLKESNTAYPESMRTMTGLDVGWLQRS